MKLFDRAVDLTPFNEQTPLYPICRAWINNQSLFNSTPTPQIKEESQNEENNFGEETDKVSIFVDTVVLVCYESHLCVCSCILMFQNKSTFIIH